MTTTDDQAEREYVRQLFAEHEDDQWGGPPVEPAKPADPMKGNHVPREGANLGPGPLTGEAEVREWARELFGRAALELP